MAVVLLAYLALLSVVMAALSGWAFAIYVRMTPKDVNMLGWTSVATVLFTSLSVVLIRAI